jgi:hypothetical protein
MKRRCSVEGCVKIHSARGYCSHHYHQFKHLLGFETRKTREICTVEGCEDKHFARGFCRLHYGRVRRNGVPELLPREKKPKTPKMQKVKKEKTPRVTIKEKEEEFLKSYKMSAAEKAYFEKEGLI